MTFPKKLRIICALIFAFISILGLFLLNNSESNASVQTTDDAYIQADSTLVAPQVSGQINQLTVNENQEVKRGDLLAIIDDHDLRIALESAKADVLSAEAIILSLQGQINRQQSILRQAKAIVVADKAGIRLAKANYQRFNHLAHEGAGTLQAAQEANTKLKIHEASREKDLAGLNAVNQQTNILYAELQKAKAGLAKAKAQQSAAELNLSYTRIIAPISGIIGHRSVRLGAYVNKGTPLLMIVPLKLVYVEANYRETQLAHVQLGQKVKIKVDALPDGILSGEVESIGPASGISYSAIPGHNATGNFTKIVQRIPVRIRIFPKQEKAKLLRVGMSVQSSIAIS